MHRNTLLALVAVSTLSSSLLTLLMAEQAQATIPNPESTWCSAPIASVSIGRVPAASSDNQRDTQHDGVVAMVSAAQAIAEQTSTEQTSTEQTIDEDAAMDFTAAESDAAVALMGCDCPACMRVLHQLQSQTFSQVLLSSNQGHCWNALRQRPPQETQEVLRGLEVEKENE